jgi:hypothetical protein
MTALVVLGGLAFPVAAIARTDAASLATADVPDQQTQLPVQPQPPQPPVQPVQPIDTSGLPPAQPTGVVHAPDNDPNLNNGPQPSPNHGPLVEPTIPTSSNAAPVVDAGADQSISATTSSVTLSGTVSDDGFPNPPGMTTNAWSQVSGPAAVTFTDPSLASTTAKGFTAAGDYVLRLTANDSALSSFDELTVRVTLATITPPATDTPRVRAARVSAVRIRAARVRAPRAPRVRAVKIRPRLTG